MIFISRLEVYSIILIHVLLSSALGVVITILISYGLSTGNSYIFGYRPILTVSGSMEPEIRTNSLGIVRKIEFKDIVVGDIISYKRNSGDNILHRVVEIQGEYLILKGDANEHLDPVLVKSNQVQDLFVKSFNGTSDLLGKLNSNEKAIFAIKSGYIILILILTLLFILSIVKISDYYNLIWCCNKSTIEIINTIETEGIREPTEEEYLNSLDIDYSKLNFIEKRRIKKINREILVTYNQQNKLKISLAELIEKRKEKFAETHAESP